MTTRTIPVAKLAELLRYEAETGLIYWRADYRRHRAGQRAFCTRSIAYLSGTIDRVTVLAHRVAFALYHGRYPAGILDHINGDGLDNRIENLRETTPRENNLNRRQRSDNTSGVTGVTWMPRNKKWMARISTPDRRFSLGLFQSIEDAAAARQEAMKALGHLPNHGRRA